MRTALWSFIGWGLCLIGTHSAQAANKSTKNFYTAAREELLKGARNCTRYIPDNWLQLMREIEPVDPTSGIQLSVPEDYLYSCLSNELKHKNDTSPFSYTSRNYITYNIALKEVVSLGFDGILAAQVRTISHSTMRYKSYNAQKRLDIRKFSA